MTTQQIDSVIIDARTLELAKYKLDERYDIAKRRLESYKRKLEHNRVVKKNCSRAIDVLAKIMSEYKKNGILDEASTKTVNKILISLGDKKNDEPQIE